MDLSNGTNREKIERGMKKFQQRRSSTSRLLFSLRKREIIIGLFVTTFILLFFSYAYECEQRSKKRLSIPSMASKKYEESVSKTLGMDSLTSDVGVKSIGTTKGNLRSTILTALSRQHDTNYTQIMMSESEVNLILKYMDGVQNYLEWGSGGSTLNFVRFVTGHAVSIEHNSNWCNKMKRKVKQDSRLFHLDYRCVIVPRGTMGWADSAAKLEGWYNPFKSYIDEIDHAGVKSYDMILNDGRARVAASIKALSYLHSGSVLIIHDARRFLDKKQDKKHGYGEILKFYDMVDVASNRREPGIAILRRKSQFSYLEGNHAQVQKMLDERYPSR